MAIPTKSPTSTLFSFTDTLLSRDCPGSQYLPASGAGDVKCSLLFQQPLDTMVSSIGNWSRQLHMRSVSEVHHLTCHQELTSVSAWELSLLCLGLVCTQNSLPCHPKTSEFFTPGELTRWLLSCFPQSSFLACGLGLQQVAPQISRQISLLIVCVQHKSVKHGPSQSSPAAFRF